MYEKLAKEYDSILVMLIGSGISGTVASATAAAAEFDKVPLKVIDTNTTSAPRALASATSSASAVSHAVFSPVTRSTNKAEPILTTSRRAFRISGAV